MRTQSIIWRQDERSRRAVDKADRFLIGIALVALVLVTAASTLV